MSFKLSLDCYKPNTGLCVVNEMNFLRFNFLNSCLPFIKIRKKSQNIDGKVWNFFRTVTFMQLFTKKFV